MRLAVAGLRPSVAMPHSYECGCDQWPRRTPGRSIWNPRQAGPQASPRQPFIRSSCSARSPLDSSRRSMLNSGLERVAEPWFASEATMPTRSALAAPGRRRARLPQPIEPQAHGPIRPRTLKGPPTSRKCLLPPEGLPPRRNPLRQARRQLPLRCRTRDHARFLALYESGP